MKEENEYELTEREMNEGGGVWMTEELNDSRMTQEWLKNDSMNSPVNGLMNGLMNGQMNGLVNDLAGDEYRRRLWILI